MLMYWIYNVFKVCKSETLLEQNNQKEGLVKHETTFITPSEFEVDFLLYLFSRQYLYNILVLKI